MGDNSRFDNVVLADFGGGAGFLAAALTKHFGTVYSYDVAEYASRYGKKCFPFVNFVTNGIDINDVLEEGPFDIVVANEFYPFTRTVEWSYGKAYIDTCIANLRQGGVLVIGLLFGKGVNNLSHNYKIIKEEYKQNNPAVVDLPYYKIANLIKLPIAYRALSKIIKLFKPRHSLIIIRRT